MVNDAGERQAVSRDQDLAIRDILLKCRGIAVVGADAAGPAGEAEFLRGVGYEVWLVNPQCRDSGAPPGPEGTVRCVPELSRVLGPVDVLYVRPGSDPIQGYLSEASRLAVGTVWLKEEGSGVSPEEIRRQGFRCIQGRSLKEEYIAHFLSTCSA